MQNLLTTLLPLFYQTPPEVPTVPGDHINAIYAYVIGVLVLTIIGIVTLYERKLITISTRLNQVIDDSMLRMERKNTAKDSALQRVNDMMLQLKEILVLAKTIR